MAGDGAAARHHDAHRSSGGDVEVAQHPGRPAVLRGCERVVPGRQAFELEVTVSVAVGHPLAKALGCARRSYSCVSNRSTSIGDHLSHGRLSAGELLVQARLLVGERYRLLIAQVAGAGEGECLLTRLEGVERVLAVRIGHGATAAHAGV